MKLDIDLNKNINIEKNQKNFLETSLGKVINTGLDLGLKAVLPNFMENQVIDVKNAILESGFKQGLKQAISSAIDIGKSAMGIFTGNFENISQIQTAVKTGGIIDSVSSLLSNSIDLARQKNLIDYNTSNLIKSGKNAILEQISQNIEENLTSQLKSIEKIEKYCNNWERYFDNKDFNLMQNEYVKIQKEIKNIIPIEKTIEKTKIVENLHKLIKNNGLNFDLTPEQIELAKKLK